MSDHPELSIVVPLYNEADNVALLHRHIVDGLRGQHDSYEIILVDDGSRDGTFDRAVSLVAGDARVRVIRLRRNYGQTAAMAAGIRHARGNVIVTMDGDLQNDPADIPMLLARLAQGYEIVAGWRRQRHDGKARVIASRVANAIISRVMGSPVRDSGCSLKAFRADLLRNLPLYGDMHRFIPAISRLAGARLAQVEVHHHPRTYGVSKYGFSRIWKVLLDIVSIRFLVGQARHPLRRPVAGMLLLFAAGVALLADAATTSANVAIIEGCLGILCLSLGVFVGASGFLTFLYAYRDPDVMCYALLSATVNADLAAPLDQGGAR